MPRIYSALPSVSHLLHLPSASRLPRLCLPLIRLLSASRPPVRYETSQGAKCLDSSNSAPLTNVELWGCHGLGGNQAWEYKPGNRIRHQIGGVCLEVHNSKLVVRQLRHSFLTLSPRFLLPPKTPVCHSAWCPGVLDAHRCLRFHVMTDSGLRR